MLMLVWLSCLSPSVLLLISAGVSLWAWETQQRAGAPAHPSNLDKHSSAWLPSSGSSSSSGGSNSPPPVVECRGADPGGHSKREIGFLHGLTPSSAPARSLAGLLATLGLHRTSCFLKGSLRMTPTRRQIERGGRHDFSEGPI